MTPTRITIGVLLTGLWVVGTQLEHAAGGRE